MNIKKKIALITCSTITSLAVIGQSTPVIANAQDTTEQDNNLIVVNPEQDTNEKGEVLIDNNGDIVRNIHTDNKPYHKDHQEAADVVVSQGDNVYTPGTGLCTLGYVDKATRRALYAGHCSKEDSNDWQRGGKSGEDVVVYDYESRQRIGYVEKNDFSGDLMDGTDFAVIKLYDDVEIGENTYSGDKWIKDFDTQVVPGKRICSYGAKTKQVTCTVIKKVYPDTYRIRLGIEGAGQKGDSGGPLWIPGEGFVGIFSSFYVDENGNRLDKNFFYVNELKNDFGKPVITPPSTKQSAPKPTPTPTLTPSPEKKETTIVQPPETKQNQTRTTTTIKNDDGETVIITIKEVIENLPHKENKTNIVITKDITNTTKTIEPSPQKKESPVSENKTSQVQTPKTSTPTSTQTPKQKTNHTTPKTNNNITIVIGIVAAIIASIGLITTALSGILR